MKLPTGLPTPSIEYQSLEKERLAQERAAEKRSAAGRGEEWSREEGDEEGEEERRGEERSGVERRGGEGRGDGMGEERRGDGRGEERRGEGRRGGGGAERNATAPKSEKSITRGTGILARPESDYHCHALQPCEHLGDEFSVLTKKKTMPSGQHCKEQPLYRVRSNFVG